MKQNNNSLPKPGEALVYRVEQLSAICTQRNINKRNIMRTFGQSNPSTTNKWWQGKDMYLYNFIKICNAYDIDVLQFLSYRGHNFTTTLEQLAKIEESGLDLNAIIESNEIKFSQSDEHEEASAMPTDRDELLRICEYQRELLADYREMNAALREQIKHYKNQPQPIRIVADGSEIK